jgi:hypothetical protein
MRAKGRNIFCTIRGKLTILYVLIFGAILTVSGIALYAIFSHQLKSDFDRSIESSAFSLGESIEEDGMSPAEILNDLSDFTRDIPRGWNDGNGFAPACRQRTAHKDR